MGGVVRAGSSEGVRLDPALKDRWVSARQGEGWAELGCRALRKPLPLSWCKGLAVPSLIQNAGPPLRLSSSPGYLGCLGVLPETQEVLPSGGGGAPPGEDSSLLGPSEGRPCCGLLGPPR